MSREESFRAAMSNAGMTYMEKFIADGKLHRFMADGDHGAKFLVRVSPWPACGWRVWMLEARL